MDASTLALIPLFADLPDADLATIASAALEVKVEPGETLAAQGQTGHALFAILSGTADVIVDGAKRAALGPGDVFGEIAMLAAGHRTASVVATSRMTLIALFNDGVSVLERQSPEAAARLRELAMDRRGTRLDPA
jgi:CRP-like cAMP-binding protein